MIPRDGFKTESEKAAHWITRARFHSERADEAEAELANAEALIRMLRERSGPKKLAEAEAALAEIVAAAPGSMDLRDGSGLARDLAAIAESALSALPPSNPEPAPEDPVPTPVDHGGEGRCPRTDSGLGTTPAPRKTDDSGGRLE